MGSFFRVPLTPEHAVAFARRHWMPMGYPVTADGREVRGDVSRAAEHHPPDFVWERLWSIRAQDLAQVFPQILDQLIEESFFGVCGVYTPRKVRKAADPLTGAGKVLGNARESATAVVIDGREQNLPRSVWGIDYLRALTAVWVDLDFYRLDLEEDAVVGELHGMQRRQEIPPISMLLFSGRGLWAFWALRDHEYPNRAVRAGSRNYRRWQAAQRVLHERLARLGADAASMDAAHVARVPGSCRHVPEGEPPVIVGWQIQGPPGSGQAFTYTLDELERQLGIEVSVGANKVAAVLDVPPAIRLRGQRGARGRVFKLLQQLEALEAMRGGWKIGTRARGVWLWIACVVTVRRWTQRLDDLHEQSATMRQVARLTDDDLFESALEIANRAEKGEGFNPRSVVNEALRRAIRERGLGRPKTKGRPVARRTVSEWLSVTPEESARLGEQGFKNPLPTAAKFVAGPALPVGAHGRKARAATRRAAVRSIVEGRARNGGPWPTLRVIAAELGNHQIDASPRTIMKDLAALGLDNPHGRAVSKAERARRVAVGSLPFGAA